mmetsp:Transcript_29602/g.76471  ORF Transcript_29602/g.76471 Transcript_29602/m.76471 type:complete len:98 (-) Transcript_29602:2399-2692(-)
MRQRSPPSCFSLFFIHAFPKELHSPICSFHFLVTNLKMKDSFRQAGISYLRYASVCAHMVRRALKEPLRKKATGRDYYEFTTQRFEGGVKVAEGKQG